MAQITITINESDSYGDGWQGQWVRIFDSNGVEVAAHTLESGSSGSDTFTLSDNADYTWTFGEGTYINEASFTMVREDTGEVLAQAQFEAASGSFSLGEAVEVVPVYHYLNLLEASIDVDGELQNAPGFDIDFDEFGPPNSYTVDAENEQLVLSTSLATGDGSAPNFKAELPDIGPGGSIVLKLAGWTFGPSAGLGTDEGEPTRHSDTMASEQIAIVLQEYQPDSLDNAESQQFINIGFLRNELGGSDSWHDLTFDVFSGNYEGAPGWHGSEDAGAGALGVYAGTEWGLNWWPHKMVAAHWNHATAAGRTGLTDYLDWLDSPYSGGSIENDSVHEAYNKLIQQFFGYYRFSRTGSNTIRIHYSPDGSTWLLVEESSDFNVQNRMGLHLWCRLSDSVVRFEDIIASENTLITNVDEAIAAAQAPAEAPAGDYVMTALDGTTDAPTGDVGFAKGDEDGFFLQSSGSYVVWFKVGGVWSKHQDGSYSGGMGFAWPASATHAYAQMSAGGQKSFMFPRTELVGMLYDSDDVDSSADKFTSAGMSYDVTEVTVTVSGTTPMDLGMASSFVQVVEAGVLSGAYSVSTGGSTVVSPPEGKDGVELLVRVFS